MPRKGPSARPKANQPLQFNPCVRFPSIQIPQGDGSVLVKAGKPQVISGEIGCSDAAKLVGLSAGRIMQMCSEGKIQARQPNGFKGKYLIPLSEIERLRKFIGEKEITFEGGKQP